MITVPTAYAETYPEARQYDAELTDKYIRHLSIGDADLDPIMEELASLPAKDLHRFTKAGIEREADVLKQAPRCCGISS